MQKFKIVLVGDGGVGKTTYIKRHLTGDFTKKYIATLGVEVHPLKFNTNHGMVVLNIWDCAGQEKFGGLREGYYVGADALIVMFDLTSLNTFKNVSKWIDRYIEFMGNNQPIVLCGNKCDIKHRFVSNAMIHECMAKYNISYFEISSKSNYNFDKPLFEVMRKLKKKEDLRFISSEHPIVIPELLELPNGGSWCTLN
jgi:GTP-binding nuclear protein Ran